MTIDILATLRGIQQKLCSLNLAHEMTDYCANDLYAIESQVTAAIEQIEKAEPVAELVSWPDDFKPMAWIGNVDLPEGTKAYLHPAAPIIPENLDEIALEIAATMQGRPVVNVVGEDLDVCGFARRLAARILGEKK